MDYVYICRAGDNEELRYSIRSVIKNATYTNIWIVGEKPDWYTGNFVHVPNIGTKYQNIKECIKAIPQIGAISEEFVLMEDDMFIVKPVGRMPIYCNGLLLDKINTLSKINPRSNYVAMLMATYKSLMKRGYSKPANYEVHIPLVMTKTGLKESIDLPGFPKSMYGNINSIGGIEIDDVKVHTKGSWIAKSYDYLNGNLPFISTQEDDSFQEVFENVLKDMFSNPSPYEKSP